MECDGANQGQVSSSPPVREHNSTGKEEEGQLWKKCNELFHSDKKITKFSIASLIIHIAVLVFVTLSTATLANEKYHFRESWIDMQKGYYSLLLKDYSDTVELRTLKYVSTSQVKILSDQDEIIDHLKYAFQRFDAVSNILLTEVTKSSDPVLCIARQMPVNFNEKHSRELIEECETLSDERRITEVLPSNLNSVSLISMEFQLKQLYLIEGYKPTCIQVDAHYTVENSDQDYLWPVRILVKGRLTMCNETLGKIHYLPIKHFHFLLWTGVLNGLVCAFGFILHCFKLLAFILVGKKVRDYATKKNLSKPLWTCLPIKLQLCLWQKLTVDVDKYAELPFIPLKAYVIFCPLMHILDMIFLVVSITGVILEFTLLRSATSTDEVIHYSTIVSFVLGLSSLYFWCTSYRLFDFSKYARVTIKSLVNSRATKAIFLALVVAAFAYIGITLLAWVLLGLFHPYFSSFRISAESFWALLYGDEILDIGDYLLPESYDHTQYFVFLMSRMILAVYGVLFPLLMLSIIMTIVAITVTEKWMCVANEKSDTDDVKSTNNFTWKVLLEWATTSDCNPFPGTLADDHKGECSDHDAVQSHCMMPAVTNVSSTSKSSEGLTNHETTNAASRNLSETEGYDLCAEGLSRHCPHQLQSSTVNVHNCSRKHVCFNLQESEI